MLLKLMTRCSTLLVSCLSGLVACSGPEVENAKIVEKYASLNSSAAKQIKSTSYENIVKESKRISPKISEIHEAIGLNLINKPYSKLELQEFVVAQLEKEGILPSMAGFKGFPAAIAVSINDELIHNLPDDTQIQPGSLVTVEIGGATNKAYAYQSWTYLVPPSSPQHKGLLDSAKKALSNAVDAIVPGAKVGDIGHAIQTAIEADGYNVVREFCGYRMGEEMMMEPQILGYGVPNTGAVIKIGQILNIHVLAIDGGRGLKMRDNGWGVYTKDGVNSVALSAMVLVSDSGGELLTGMH